MRRAISYVRFSTPAQMQGDSLRRQTAATEDYCRRHDLVIDDVRLEDLGVSAFKGQNVSTGALAGFLSAVETGRIARGTVLIVENIDRLSRDQVGAALSKFLDLLNSGIHIVTLEPEREYTQASVNNIANLLEPIINMQRAYEESNMKSVRGKASWDAKRQDSSIKLTGRVPAWLRLRADRTGFDMLPDQVEVVRTIYRMAVEGYGLSAITKHLNAQGAPAIGRARHWQRSYVSKILANRAVLGEYQPHTVVVEPLKRKNPETGKDEVVKHVRRRTPQGPALPDYYPRIISDDVYYRAQGAKTSRKTQRGRVGTGVRNLFTGILYDARDGCKMHVVNKGVVKLVSAGAIRGQPGSVYASFPYAPFEYAILRFMREIHPGDVVAGAVTAQDDVEALSGRLEGIEAKIAKVTAWLAEDPTEEMRQVLDRQRAQRKATQEALERARALASDAHSETLADVQAMAATLDATPEGPERDELRTRIKARIRSLVSEIWMYVWKHTDPKRTYAEVQVFMKCGKHRMISVMEDGWCMGSRHAMNDMMPTVDLRNHRHPQWGGVRDTMPLD